MRPAIVTRVGPDREALGERARHKRSRLGLIKRWPIVLLMSPRKKEGSLDTIGVATR